MVNKLLFCLVAPLVAVAAVACGGDKAAPEVKATVTATALPAIYKVDLSPASGPPGTEVTLTGTNWPPGLPITITTLNRRRRTAKPYATLNATETGTFKATFRLDKTPGGADLKPGRLDLNVASLKGATAPVFTVEASRPVPESTPAARGVLADQRSCCAQVYDHDVRMAVRVFRSLIQANRTRPFCRPHPHPRRHHRRHRRRRSRRRRRLRGRPRP